MASKSKPAWQGRAVPFAEADARYGLARLADKVWGLDAIFPPGEPRPVRVVRGASGEAKVPRGITVIDGDLDVDVLRWRARDEAVLVITGTLRVGTLLLSGPANLWLGALVAQALVATELSHAGSLIVTGDCAAPAIVMLGDGEHILPRTFGGRIVQRDAALLARRWGRAEPASGALAAGIATLDDVAAAIADGRTVVRSVAEIGPTLHGRPIATLEELGSTRDTRALATIAEGTVFPRVVKLDLPEHALNARAASMRWPVLEQLSMDGPHSIPVGSTTPDAVAIPDDMFASMPELRRLRITAFRALPPAVLTIAKLESLDLDQAIFNPVFYTRPDPGLRLADLATLRARYPQLRIAFGADVCFELPAKVAEAITAATKTAQLLAAGKLDEAIELVEAVLGEIALDPGVYSHVLRYDLRALAIFAHAKRDDARATAHAQLGLAELGPPSGWFLSDRGLGSCRQLAKLAGNHLAWSLRTRDPQTALGHVELALRGSTLGVDDHVFDTHARILLALGRHEEAYRVVAQVVRGNPKFEAVRDIVRSRGYRSFTKETDVR